MDGMAESEPTQSSACCAGPGSYRPIGQFRVHRKFNVPIKAGHGPSHSTDINWSRLLPPTGPSQSRVRYIERRSVSNPDPHHRKSSALPTDVRDGQLSFQNYCFWWISRPIS